MHASALLKKVQRRAQKYLDVRLLDFERDMEELAERAISWMAAGDPEAADVA